MAKNNFLDTSTVSFSDILANGKLYQVPLYQRDYSWNVDHWEDLWADIMGIANSTGNAHYMGSVVFQDKGDKKYTIIDGQQRLATLSLIVLSIINKLQELVNNGIDCEDNKERIDILKNKFIGDKDPGSLTYSSKLQLNENNNSFFQSYLLVFRMPVNVRALRSSERRLWDAYIFFSSRIIKHFVEEKDGSVITNFLNKVIAEKLMFIQIVVEDELRAYTVFETLNSRGVGLTVTDLLKNYLFSLASEVDLRHIKEQWNRIIAQIGLDGFPTFLRHFWISGNKLIRQEYLFRTIKKYVRNSEEVFDLLDRVEKCAQLYAALSNPSDSFWIGERERKKRIRELELFKVKMCFPILLAGYEKLTNEVFDKLLKIISIISFRYIVIGSLHTNRLEEIYNRASMKIVSGKISKASQIAHELEELYPIDKDFKNSFETKTINTKSGKKLVRYILFELENQKSQSDRDFEDDPATIEHILPENPNDDTWNVSFPSSVQETYIYRLGNYILLETKKNRECGTLSFEVKKEVYQTSQYSISKDIDFAEWTPNSLDNRQTQMANQAISIWRLPYLD